MHYFITHAQKQILNVIKSSNDKQRLPGVDGMIWMPSYVWRMRNGWNDSRETEQKFHVEPTPIPMCIIIMLYYPFFSYSFGCMSVICRTVTFLPFDQFCTLRTVVDNWEKPKGSSSFFMKAPNNDATTTSVPTMTRRVLCVCKSGRASLQRQINISVSIGHTLACTPSGKAIQN